MPWVSNFRSFRRLKIHHYLKFPKVHKERLQLLIYDKNWKSKVLTVLTFAGQLNSKTSCLWDLVIGVIKLKTRLTKDAYPGQNMSLSRQFYLTLTFEKCIVMQWHMCQSFIAKDFLCSRSVAYGLFVRVNFCYKNNIGFQYTPSWHLCSIIHATKFLSCAFRFQVVFLQLSK